MLVPVCTFSLPLATAAFGVSSGSHVASRLPLLELLLLGAVATFRSRVRILIAAILPPTSVNVGASMDVLVGVSRRLSFSSLLLLLNTAAAACFQVGTRIDVIHTIALRVVAGIFFIVLGCVRRSAAS